MQITKTLQLNMQITETHWFNMQIAITHWVNMKITKTHWLKMQITETHWVNLQITETHWVKMQITRTHRVTMLSRKWWWTGVGYHVKPLQQLADIYGCTVTATRCPHVPCTAPNNTSISLDNCFRRQLEHIVWPLWLPRGLHKWTALKLQPKYIPP